MSTASLTARAFAPGDEPALVELWNRAHAGYGGHVPRTVESWRWCILERPGVDGDDIILLATGGGRSPIAYGVLGPGGMVLELAIEPTVLGVDREAVGERLVSALEARCRARGDEMIVFELPRVDAPVHRLMQRSGYRVEDTGSLQVAIVDLAALLEALLRHRQGRFPHAWSPAFRLEVAPGDYRFCPQRSLRVRLAPELEVAVEEAAGGERPEADCTVSVDLSTLTDIIFRRGTFEEALVAGKVAVRPASRQQDARTLMSFLVLKCPWYTPSADGR